MIVLFSSLSLFSCSSSFCLVLFLFQALLLTRYIASGKSAFIVNDTTVKFTREKPTEMHAHTHTYLCVYVCIFVCTDKHTYTQIQCILQENSCLPFFYSQILLFTNVENPATPCHTLSTFCHLSLLPVTPLPAPCTFIFSSSSTPATPLLSLVILLHHPSPASATPCHISHRYLILSTFSHPYSSP